MKRFDHVVMVSVVMNKGFSMVFETDCSIYDISFTLNYAFVLGS